MEWPEVQTWRRARRAEMLARRAAMTGRQKQRVRETVGDLIRTCIPGLSSGPVGFYWPCKGEIDLRPLVREGVIASAALPVVVQKAQPLEFWAWQHGGRIQRGFWRIPVPAERSLVHPAIVLAPLVGFDEQGYRLGYGGGYFDRTLASIDPMPLTVGVGYEFSRLASIHPQAHDIALDAIITESGCHWLRRPRDPLAPGDAP